MFNSTIFKQFYYLSTIKCHKIENTYNGMSCKTVFDHSKIKVLNVYRTTKDCATKILLLFIVLFYVYISIKNKLRHDWTVILSKTF